VLGSPGTPAIGRRVPARGRRIETEMSSSRCATARCACSMRCSLPKPPNQETPPCYQGEVTRIPALPLPFALKIPQRVFQQSFSEMPRSSPSCLLSRASRRPYFRKPAGKLHQNLAIGQPAFDPLRARARFSDSPWPAILSLKKPNLLVHDSQASRARQGSAVSAETVSP